MANDQKTEKDIDVRMASAHLQERRETRHDVPLQIDVTGIRNGEVFHSRTTTRNVSDWGCSFVIPFELKTEDIVAIRIVSESSDAAAVTQSMFQVVRIIKEPEGWLVGAWKLDGKNLWGAALQQMSLANDKEANAGDEAPVRERTHREPEL
jgi:hypothetical protein